MSRLILNEGISCAGALRSNATCLILFMEMRVSKLCCCVLFPEGHTISKRDELAHKLDIKRRTDCVKRARTMQYPDGKNSISQEDAQLSVNRLLSKALAYHLRFLLSLTLPALPRHLVPDPYLGNVQTRSKPAKPDRPCAVVRKDIEKMSKAEEKVEKLETELGRLLESIERVDFDDAVEVSDTRRLLDDKALIGSLWLRYLHKS
ncbi:hypothetical protein IW262DRAFT_1302670 [Armillaria fumosa]|nr:hypothetical protein IW262DRAFT_1302670 [Armillaria fumosa]